MLNVGSNSNIMHSNCGKKSNESSQIYRMICSGYNDACHQKKKLLNRHPDTIM